MLFQEHNTAKGLIVGVVLMVGIAFFRMWSNSQSRVDAPVQKLDYQLGESFDLEDLNPEELNAITKFMADEGFTNKINAGESPATKQP